MLHLIENERFDDESDLASLNNLDTLLLFEVFHEKLLFINLAEEKILVKDLNTLENCDFGNLACDDFLDDEAHEFDTYNYANNDVCVAAGKHDSLYLVSKVRRFNNSYRERFVGTYFYGYKLYEDGKTWQKKFQTEIIAAPDEECEADSCMNMYAKISSASNEMIVVHSADKLNIVFVVDLNQENASPVTLLSDEILTSDMIIGTGTRIVEANDAMYIVTDGTAVENSYKGKANVRYEYKLNSLRLREIYSIASNLGQFNETYNHSKDIRHDGVLSPCNSEMSASFGDGLWYIEGDKDVASFLTKVSVDDDRNPVVEHHTPPPFPSITAMFAGKISSNILENKKLVTRFYDDE